VPNVAVALTGDWEELRDQNDDDAPLYREVQHIDQPAARMSLLATKSR
jgi:hypothetical protein